MAVGPGVGAAARRGAASDALNRRELIREHVWLTTQPIDEPPRAADFGTLLDDLGMNDRIMFATDYPHWDFDAPDRALPTGLDHGVRERIMAGNARSLYRL